MDSEHQWQFSLRSLLVATAALAIWVCVTITMPVEASWRSLIFRLGMILALCSFTLLFHRMFRNIRLTWPGAALLAGIVVMLMLLFLAIDNQDLSIISPWQ